MTAEEWYKGGEKLMTAGVNVFYRHEGRGEALICIHGFPTSSWDFAPLWEQLTNRFEVLAADLVGLGRSDKPNQNVSIAMQADVIEALAIDQGIHTAHILAHDLGDTVAQELLARQIENKAHVKWLSCVFLNGGIFPEVHRPRFIQKLLISPLGSLVAKLSTERTFRRNMRNIFSKQYPPEEEFIRDSWRLLMENGGVQMLPRLIRYMNERWEHRDRWVLPLENAKVPIRLINGVLDPVSGLHAANYYIEVVPNPDVVLLDDAGHYPHVEVPEKVWGAFLDFHGRLPSHRVYN
ncbi:MAG: alpha/beta hydrolase [Cyclobacteriaceae bacterium]